MKSLKKYNKYEIIRKNQFFNFLVEIHFSYFDYFIQESDSFIHFMVYLS